MKFFSKIVPFLILFVFNFSCSKQTSKIPNVYVDIALDLNKPEFYELNAVGNYLYITGGVSGIVVYRDSPDKFYAYERACPYDPECGRVFVNDSNYRLVDTACCGSEFSMTMDGAVMKGPSQQPLKQYRTYYYPETNILHITN